MKKKVDITLKLFKGLSKKLKTLNRTETIQVKRRNRELRTAHINFLTKLSDESKILTQMKQEQNEEGFSQLGKTPRSTPRDETSSKKSSFSKVINSGLRKMEEKEKEEGTSPHNISHKKSSFLKQSNLINSQKMKKMNRFGSREGKGLTLNTRLQTTDVSRLYMEGGGSKYQRSASDPRLIPWPKLSTHGGDMSSFFEGAYSKYEYKTYRKLKKSKNEQIPKIQNSKKLYFLSIST